MAIKTKMPVDTFIKKFFSEELEVSVQAIPFLATRGKFEITYEIGDLAHYQCTFQYHIEEQIEEYSKTSLVVSLDTGKGSMILILSPDICVVDKSGTTMIPSQIIAILKNQPLFNEIYGNIPAIDKLIKDAMKVCEKANGVNFKDLEMPHKHVIQMSDKAISPSLAPLR